MSLSLSPNDISNVVAADREHVWHHLSQHKQYETNDPRVSVEGKALRGRQNERRAGSGWRSTS